MIFSSDFSHIRFFMSLIISLMAALSLALLLRQQFLGERDAGDREVWLRVKTWWAIVFPFFFVLCISNAISVWFFCFVSYLSFKEFITFIPKRSSDHRVIFWAYCSIPVQYYFIHISWYGMFIVFIPVYIFLLLPVRMLLRGDTQDFLRAVGTLHWGLMSTVFGLSHAAFLLTLRREGSGEEYGVGLVLFLVFLTEANDIAQYCWGKAFGRAKVVPSVSPNKTWAGLVGGVTTTMILAGLAGPFLSPLSFPRALVVGLMTGIIGFFGDICVSAIKRDIGIKDSGKMLPGHGGILDRVDSLTFTAPIFFHFIYYNYH
jgi:phosphatidate cytidylyltransferase